MAEREYDALALQRQRRRTWRFGQFIIVRRAELLPGEQEERVPIERHLDLWLRDPLLASTLAEMLSHTSAASMNSVSGGPLHRRQWLRDGVLEAFRRRELVLLQWLKPAGGTAVPVQPVETQAAMPKPVPAKPEVEKTWVEFRLVDQKGKPVPGARYRMKITDGSVRTGSLDVNGSVRVPGLYPGMCEISFLDYDAREWKRI